MTATQHEQIFSAMERAIADLREMGLRAAASIKSDWTTAASTQDAALKSVAATVARIETILVPQSYQVLNGTRTFENWSAYAKALWDDLAYQAKVSGEWPLSSVLAGALRATGSDIVEGAKSVAIAATAGLSIYALVLGVFFVLLIVPRLAK